jgi:lysophospholipase L1-like esterase
MPTVLLLFLALVISPGPGPDPAVSSGWTVACAGDSLMRPIPAHIRAIEAERPGDRLTLLEWAQGGLRTDTYLAFLRRNLAEWGEKRPDAILLQIGTNDALPLLEGRSDPAAFRDKLAAVLAAFGGLRGGGRPHPVLLVATVPRFADGSPHAAKNRIVEDVINPALAAAVAAAGGLLVDNHAVLLDRPDLYDPDGIHPNAAGERALALNWLAALRVALPEKRP